MSSRSTHTPSTHTTELPDLVVLSHLRWSWVWQRPQHIISRLAAERAELVIRKGYHRHVDSYSAFVEADRTTRTGLAGYLRERGFTRVVVCGLATDYCVGWSALDARTAGFEAVVITDAVRGIDIDGSVARTMAAMAAAGISFAESDAYTALP